MLVDSHCHLNFPELIQNMDQVLDHMQNQEVGHALCVSVTLDKFPEVLAIAEQYPNIFASVGVHPDYEDIQEPTLEALIRLADHPRVIAIGETGLDYFRLTGDLEWQRERFRIHIRAAKATGKPLIIHTRNAAEDTLRIMQEEGAAEVGGVMHCFTESWEVAQAAIAMGFYISFSGIVTFKNAQALKQVAQLVPLDKVLVETDSPYLAPIPFRGKTNQPGYVRHVAEEVARLRDIPLQTLIDATTANFFTLFKHATPCN
ncbi:TatD family hydrolase [Methylophilus medardicus]|uniref:TatD family deoxyribonuclease n=1 Tax=Methylophilus medardicus TaxID=2588534 RepID=A0A5B8CSS5_9PROT|nr:TatD family hydrolase [Methylophilus medardicus]QDC44269.1 TatD family deoxyribonuclease [Methylophilus medardicus]QDC49276.1 TatD family deoxyribonuclease [Methylophilus medardicus]QDC52981.1 TatD family deoxyribonuclease [Methylophilus medardicus]